jgi:hypothetical protein
MMMKHLLIRNIQQFPSEIFDRLMICMTITIATYRKIIVMMMMDDDDDDDG